MNCQKYSLWLVTTWVCWASLAAAALAQGALPTPGQGGQPPGTPAAGGPADALYRQQVSYMIGQNMGSSLRQNQVEVEPEMLVAGLMDAIRGAQPKWSEAELKACQTRFQQEMQTKAAGRMHQMADANTQQGQQFLAQNKRQPGVQVTQSGLQYKVLKQGTGATPALTDKVRCHYRGTFLDGTEFDSSLGGDPAEFTVNEVIPGWTEALQRMRVGDKWQLFVPGELAYGAEGRPGIPPNSLLVFEVELLGINGQ